MRIHELLLLILLSIILRAGFIFAPLATFSVQVADDEEDADADEDDEEDRDDDDFADEFADAHFDSFALDGNEMGVVGVEVEVEKDWKNGGWRVGCLV
ncbi:uncharacterized protein BO80DRAFT_426529, partial [Aspergillus ibericus CBS 121593]